MSTHSMSRRLFFQGALMAGAVPLGGFGSAVSLKALGYRSPNERLNIAVIGAGGRAEIDIPGCASENLVAFADPDDSRAAPTYLKYPAQPKFRDYRRMLDKEGRTIDAVLIATPDHMHAAAALWSMERGKHVYLEKPMGRTIWETRRLVEAANRYKVATQMGNQGYSNEASRIAAEIVWSGEIGPVTEVHAWTNRPVWPQGVRQVPADTAAPGTLDWDTWLGIAKARPYAAAYAPFNWRGFFDFGCGALGDMACHVLGAPNLGLRLGAPSSVELLSQDGRTELSFPTKSTIRFDFPARGSMPPVKVFWYDGQNGPAYRPAGMPEGERLIAGPGAFGLASTRPAAPAPPKPQVSQQAQVSLGSGDIVQSNGAVWVGEKGYLTTDSHGGNTRLVPLERMQDYKLPAQVLTRSPGHYADWIRACKGGEPACSNFAIAGPFTEMVLLGVIAQRLEGKLEWDSAAMRFTNRPEANSLLKPETIRKGWGL